MIVDFTNIYRVEEVCQPYTGNELVPDVRGDYVRFDDVVAILKANGIEVKSYETVKRAEFEAEMEAEFGPNWRS